MSIRNACFSHEFADMLHFWITFKNFQGVAALQISSAMGCSTRITFGVARNEKWITESNCRKPQPVHNQNVIAQLLVLPIRACVWNFPVRTWKLWTGNRPITALLPPVPYNKCFYLSERSFVWWSTVHSHSSDGSPGQEPAVIRWRTVCLCTGGNDWSGAVTFIQHRTSKFCCICVSWPVRFHVLVVPR